MSEKKKSNKGLVAIIIILVLALGAMGYLLFDKETAIETKDSRITELEMDLTSSLAEIQSYSSENDSMNNYIVSREAYLQRMLDSVQDVKNATDRQLARWKNETYKLKREISDMSAIVDSVNAAYAKLYIENDTIKSNLAAEIARSEELSVRNTALADEVAVGGVLRLSSINAGAYKVSSSGEEDETDRARRAERIKTCITITENPIAKKGEREVIMRVVTPSSKVLAAPQDSTGSGSNMFSVNGNNLYYTAKKMVWYENENTNVCLTYDGEDFAKGTYNVEVYVDGVMTQEARFVLD